MAAKRALLIGINAYPNLERQFPDSRPLSGCLKDVDTMAALLEKRGFGDIRRVIDGDETPPTRRHILQAMEGLYEDVARDAAESDDTKEAGVVVFFFAGHGSQVRSRGVPGSRLQEHTFQTLVTSDSGRTLPSSEGTSLPNRDLFDFEIDAWVRRLRRLTPAPAITLIFDCCHSAGLSSDQRGWPGETAPSPDAETERSAPADLRDWDALGLDGSVQEAWKELVQSSIGQTRGVSGWSGRTLQEAVVLAACRNEETSMGNAQGGFLTHALSKALERHPEAPSWRDVFDPLSSEALSRLKSSPAVHEHFAPIYSKVQGRNRRQHPVRHGNGPIFEFGTYDYSDGYPDSATAAPLKTFAVVIGIADYGGDWADLQNARRDAEAVAATLEQQQGYEVLRTSSGAAALCDHEATFLGIFRHLNRLRRAVRAYRKSAAGRHRGTASVVYFAGHGASVPEIDRRRVKGYLIPHGGRLNAPETWLSMQLLRQFLTGPPADDPRPKRRLRSRHLLLVLDCCFAGAIRFAPLRRKESLARPIFASEYRRFVEGQAWQVLTSSSYHQSALDIVRDPRDPRDPGSRHSPFAQALIEALSTGVADASDEQGRRDRILTAGEIHQFLDQRLKVFDFQQPGLAPLSPGNRGQFFFRVPGWQTVATPDPPLDEANNPWPGVAAYDARPEPADTHPFHGRQAPLLQLLAALLQDEPGPRMLVGASGSGKTSLVLGGLWPLLQDLKAHRHTIRRWVAELSHAQLLLSPSDLAGVRRWMHDLKLPELFNDAEALRQRVVAWGRQQGDLAPGNAPSPTEMSGTMPPSLLDLIATERHADHPWWERARLEDLLARPTDLVFHLRFWHQEPGLADLLLFEPEGEEMSASVEHWNPWLQPWHVVYLKGEDLLDTSAWHPQFGHPQLESHLQDAPSDVPRLLVLDGFDGLLASPDFRRHGLPVLEKLAGSEPDGPSALPWRVLWILGSHKQPRPKGETSTSEEPSPWQRQVFLPSPSHQELRDAIEQPLLDRALLMPNHLVDRLAEAAHGAAAPLALLSPCLHAMYKFAVNHRKAEDRSLTLDHYSAVGSLTGPWRRLVRSAIGSAAENDRHAMFRLLRRFAWQPDQKMDRRTAFDPKAASPPGWLRQLMTSRAVVRDATGFRLGHEDLLQDWSAFESWRRSSPAAPREDLLAQLAPRALKWFIDTPLRDRPASDLWDDHAEVLALLDLRDELNAVEQIYLEASLERCRARLARRLAGEALRAPERRWNHSLLLAAQALDLARADSLRRHEALAREGLRRLLAMSPLSLKMDLPGIARKLSWPDEQQLHVLTSPQATDETSLMTQSMSSEDPWQDDWVWQLELGSPRPSPELMAVSSAPNVKGRPVRFQEAEEVMLEAADASETRFARLIPFSQRLSLERKGHPAAQGLRGLGLGLRYLAWSPSDAWLAAVCQPEDAEAAGPSYGPTPSMQNAVAELRLWRCADDASSLEAAQEPRSLSLQTAISSISYLAFAAEGKSLLGLDQDQAPFCVDLESPIPTSVDPSRALGSAEGRWHGWHGRTFPPPSSSSEEPSETRWLWAIQRSRGKSTVRLWNLQVPGTSQEVATEGVVRNVHTVSSKGSFLVDQRGRSMRLLDTADGRELAVFRSVDLMEISPNERWAVLAGGKALRFVPLETPQQIPVKLPLEVTSSLETLRIAPNGRWLALRSREGTPQSSNDISAAEIHPVPGNGDGPDLANVWLWFLPEGQPLQDNMDPSSFHPTLAVQGCRFAFDSAGTHWVVAHASALQWFRLDEDGSCQRMGQYALASYPTVLTFHPGGDRVAVGGLDGSVVLLSCPEPGAVDVDLGTETLRRSDDNPQAQSVHALAFDGAGERLAVALAAPPQAHSQRHLGGMLRARPQAEPDALVAIYDLSSDRLAKLARACAGRVLDETTWQRHLAPEPYRPGNLEAANDLMRERLGIQPTKPPKT